MAQGNRQAQDDWVRTVLGVDFGAAPRGPVDYAKLLLRWRAAQQQAEASLRALGAALLKAPEVQADPRLATVQQAVATLPGLVPRFGDALADHIDAAMSAGGGEAGQAHLRAASESVAAYRQQLAGVPALAALSDFAKRQVGVDMNAHAALEAALTEIDQEIRARLA